MLKKRKKLWIDPSFQRRIILYWALQALFVSVLTYVLTALWTAYRAGPDWADYALSQVNPALLVSAGLSFALSCLAGLIYSHRIAGPLARIKATIDEVAAGRFARPIVLRPDDELKDLAGAVNRLLQCFWVSRKE